MEESSGFVFMACFFEDNKFWFDYQYMGIVFVDQVFYIFVVVEYVGGYFVKGNFLVDDFFGSVIKGFKYIDLFFELGDEFFDYFFCNLYYDGKMVDVWLGRLVGGEVFDVDMVVVEDGNYL